MLPNITESDLQLWFENKSKQQTIVDFIVNPEVINTQQKWRQQDVKNRDRIRISGLDNAKKVLEGLRYANHLSGNRSVSDKGHTQLRPDLILISQDANYLLVELKTREKTERQAVQELLAYSAAMKMQQPFTNDFMFIIVAVHWDTLLRFSVQSLIMDGKLVLPLALELSQSGEYQLRILQSLFDFKFKDSYDPFYAMKPSTIATSINNSYNSSEAKCRINRYFRGLAYEIAAECRKVQQSGFVISWRNLRSHGTELFSLTVVTVNQFWKYSDQASSYIDLNEGVSIRGISRVQQNAANILRDEINSRPVVRNEILDELEDAFRSAEAWQAEASLHAQSSLSSDLINKHINYETEKAIKQTGAIQEFELGGWDNLELLLLDMQEIQPTRIDVLSVFGDVADFFRKQNLPNLWFHPNFYTFQKLMEDFRTSKRDR
ncbi:hypothetical protein [Klebsiella quasipneumoniae]|uniref:hypothetical protein n=1 Tax=Klebsiella quasipneumoniae TaxID=1463165 RepID=UPI00388EC094|nr:hypothetical protein [Klebsiella quasipneumoniae subsp. quasipneumoniae]HBW1722033.1 hypothetical protein [Klebsiella quasipneumoniae subsp. quasipneumoniae]HBW1728130.1 hypothetical protein [Klebsiella quasipneumoniae subsp. quasipneumoniae]HBW1815819.1 hypothetical protein [Klebsiella quasipneumoniae subsp. quasipneumoniae]HCM4041485.1 hypothetical protein [Klebsiella quasipneumoniae subsp. quasipneumoniae]